MRAGQDVIAAGGSAEQATEAARKIAQADPDESFAAAAKAENQTATGRPPAASRQRVLKKLRLFSMSMSAQQQADIAADAGQDVKALEARLEQITKELPINDAWNWCI